MSSWHHVANVDDLPPGTARELTAGGRVVALFRTEEGVYALDGVCPHAGGPLGNGTLQGNVVTCPWHGWQFDVTSGLHCLNPNLQHTRFPVRIDGNEIHVEIPDSSTGS